MYRYECHFGSFYRNPTILETVSIVSKWVTTENLFLLKYHYGDVVMGTMASQITSLTIVYSTIDSGADQIKHQISASLAFVRGIHRGPVNSPHKWPVTRKTFPFDDVIMTMTGNNSSTDVSLSR